MTDLKKETQEALEDHISAGRIHPRWRSFFADAWEVPSWAKALRAKLDEADRAKAQQAGEHGCGRIGAGLHRKGCTCSPPYGREVKPPPLAEAKVPSFAERNRGFFSAAGRGYIQPLGRQVKPAPLAEAKLMVHDEDEGLRITPPYSDWQRFVGRAQRRGLAGTVQVSQETPAQAKEREAKAIAAALEREPTWPPGAKAEVTWAGDHWSCMIVDPAPLKHVVIKGTISLGELRCECGSGNHLRGPGHSNYCQLWEKS